MKKQKSKIDGWIVLDKPYGMTSTQAVGKVRWLFNAEKAGHGGTLDPLATGLLPIALGEATKTVQWAMDGRKTYRFTAAWGVQTNTDDLEGEITQRSDKRPTKADIEALLPRFTGTIFQAPPAFSAIKINGERAYDLARAGEATMFRSTPLCEGRHAKRHRAITARHSFDPRPCVKGDFLPSNPSVSAFLFRSTPLCEGRPLNVDGIL